MKSIREGGAIATYGMTTVSPSRPAAAPCSQASTSTRPGPLSPLAVSTTRSRNSRSEYSGRSMPVFSSSERRNGVDDGHEPTQMPQETQSEGLTSAWVGNGSLSVLPTSLMASYGQSSAQRAQPLQ